MSDDRMGGRGEAAGRTLGRKEFLVAAGAGAGLALAGPLVSARAAGEKPLRLKVGVMLPSGSSYAHMGTSLLQGIELGFRQERDLPRPVSATFVHRQVDRGYGGAEQAAKSLLDQGADVVIGGVSALVADRLGPLFGRRKKPLIVANVGAHVVQPGQRHDQVLHSSLLYWQASYAAGRWAATHVGKRAFIAAALPDTGYDLIYAFRRGFQSEGGRIVGSEVSHVRPGKNELAGLFAQIRNSGANVVYGVYSGQAAREFVFAYPWSGVNARLLLGGLAVEDYMLPGLGAASIGITSCSSWTRTRPSGHAVAFNSAFESRFDRPADPFAALGHDTAALVARGLRRTTAQGNGTAGLIASLGGVRLDSPRGTLVVDPATNVVNGQLWMRKVMATKDGPANVDIANALAVGSFPHVLAPLESGTVAGWINEYLCA